jgi:hypothetical protein
MADTEERARARRALRAISTEEAPLRETEKAINKREYKLEHAGEEEGIDAKGTDAGEMEPKWDDRFKKG